MPQTVTEPRKATRTTILKDEVPAPPLPEQGVIPGMEPPPGEDFDAFVFLQRLKGSDWNDYMVYLYWSPPGQRRLGPYLDVITEPVTIDWVRKRFGGSGGGRYVIWVNHQADPPWRKTTEFEIEGDRIFVGKPVTEANSATSGQSTPLEKMLETLIERLTKVDPNVQGVIDMQKKGFETTVETISKATGTQAPSLDIITVIRTLKELGLIGKPEGGGVIETIKALKELGVLTTPAAGGDITKQIESVGKAVAAIKDIAGGGEGGEGDWKSAAVKGIIDGLPHFRAMTADIANAAKFNAMAQSNSQRVAPPSEASETQISPNPQKPLETPPSASNPQIAAPAGGAEPPQWEISDYLWNRVAFMIREGADGDQIAQWLRFATLDPESKNADLTKGLAAYTEGGLLTLMDSKPEVKAALEGKDSFLLAKQFLHFCKTLELCDDEEEAIEGEEPPELPKA